MTDRTWVGGYNDNDALTPDNWSPAGELQPGDHLTVVNGTLNITKTDLAGNTLNLANKPGDGPVVLDLNGKAKIEATGSSNFGDPLTINATGHDSLEADHLSTVTGTIDVAAHSKLVVTGSMYFAYSGGIEGAGTVTNNGTISMGDANVSASITGHGALVFHQSHHTLGHQTISGSVSSGQDIQLVSDFYSPVLTLTDPSTFHGSLDLVPSPGITHSPASIVLDGINASSFRVQGHSVTLLNGCQPVYHLRLDNPGAVSISLHEVTGGTSISLAANS